jgi:hypothetical protein
VNSRLKSAAERGERRWIVVNEKSDVDAPPFRALVDSLLAPAKPEYVLGGFGAALPPPA